ncbi:glycerate kinase [Biomphalaria glabrata]|nr:glycerate kinase-like [Biomphalaria glabrata]
MITVAAEIRCFVTTVTKFRMFGHCCKQLYLNAYKDYSELKQTFIKYQLKLSTCRMMSSKMMSSSTETGLIVPTFNDKVLSTSVDLNMQLVMEARSIFQTAVNAVLPHQMIWNKLNYDKKKSTLHVDGIEYILNNNLYVVGFGKAVIGMARAIEDKLGDHMVTGVLSVPQGISRALLNAGKQDMLLLPSSKFEVIEGASQNLPDKNAYKAAMEIKRIAMQVSGGDILIVLISGGGSALLPTPEPPVTLDDMLTVTKLMSRAGATIIDLNTVRKQIDILKGGGLAELAWPAKTISLILSDVIGDPLDFIASGPTVPDCTSPQDVLKLFSELGIKDAVPQSVHEVIQRKLQQTSSVSCSPVSQTTEENSRPHDWSHVQNVLVGTNKIACEVAFDKSLDYELLPLILSTEVKGEAREVGELFAVLGKFIAGAFITNSTVNDLESLLKTEYKTTEKNILTKAQIQEISDIVNMAKTSDRSGICIVAGGETTVTVRGEGKGGRNQEMAVAFALKMASCPLPPHVKVIFLSAGTDGQDGPTPSAGAVVSPEFLSLAQTSGLDAADYLDRNDTHTLLSLVDNGSCHVVTGLTGTNVMDLHLLIVKSNSI